MKPDRHAAFERFCRDEYASVVRAAYLVTGDREEALDVAQEAFARAFERWGTISGYEQPATWVHRVAVNLAISWRRRQRVRATKLLPGRSDSVAQFDVPDAELLSALRQLTPAQRAVVVLRYYVDRSIDEVSRDLGKRPGTVRALSAQALSRLRHTLSSDEVSDDARA